MLVKAAVQTLCAGLSAPHDGQQLWPMFIFTSHRAETACLERSHPHLLGVSARRSVFVVVLSPDEEPSYRQLWPNALFLLLPKSSRGLSYSRCVVHTLCTGRIPFYWAFDDNIIKFAELTGRNQPPSAISVHYALLKTQQISNIAEFALAGFLRAIGRESCISKSFAVDNPTFYKVFLVNTVRCAGSNYIAELSKWEDIAFVRSLLLKGRHVLKVNCLAYYAITTRQGGCQAARVAPSDSLVHSWASDLSDEASKTISALHRWLATHAAKPTPAKLAAKRQLSAQSAVSGSCRCPSVTTASQPTLPLTAVAAHCAHGKKPSPPTQPSASAASADPQ